MLRAKLYISYWVEEYLFHSPAVLLQKISKVVLFVFEAYIMVVGITVTSFITRIRGAQIVMNIGTVSDHFLI